MTPRTPLLLSSGLLLLTLLGPLAAAGCATSAGTLRPPAAPPPLHRGAAAAIPVSRVELDPLRITVNPPGHPGGRTTVVEAGTLFEQAGEELRAGRFVEALQRYDEFLADFGDSRFARAALFNSGLALEALGRYAAAAERFSRLAGPPGRPPAGDAEARDDIKDALFRLSGCLAEGLDWKGSAATLDRLFGEHELNATDRVEALARRGLASLRLGDEARAEQTFEKALAFAERNRGVERLETDFFLAMAHYHLGLLLHGQLRRLPIRLPERVMARDLEARANQVLKAQARYIRTLRVGNAHWGTAAGFQIASLFQELHEDLVKAPVPPEVRGEARTVYHEELRRRIRPLIERALKIHQKNLEMARRVGAQNAWVTRSGEQLERLQRLLQPGAQAPAPAPPTPARDKPPGQRDHRSRTVIL